MSFTIRPMAVPDDFERLAELTNTYRTETMTAADMADAYRTFPEGGVRCHEVAVEEAGYIGAYGFVRRLPYDPPGRFVTRVLVDSRYRGQGMGAALYRSMERFAREQGATILDSDVRDSDPYGLAWAQRRGFAQFDHVFESVLDLATFDEAPFAGLVERLEASGLRFLTLADEPGEEGERKLYDLVAICSPDNPLYQWTEFVPFEQWKSWYLTSPSMPPSQYILAADGDRFVGMTSIERLPDSGAMYTDFTCVRRECRGRSLALALKLLSVRLARQLGAPYMRTNNASENLPMLAVNRKLGYAPVPGFYGVRKRLE